MFMHYYINVVNFIAELTLSILQVTLTSSEVCLPETSLLLNHCCQERADGQLICSRCDSCQL